MFLSKFIKTLIRSYDLLLLSILIVAVALTYFHFEMSHIKERNLNKILKQCKTGDIILFKWNFTDLIVRFASKFNHIGLIYKKKNRVYIIEMNPEDDKLKEGVHKYNLKKRLKKFDGTCYYAKLNKNIHIDNNNLEKLLKKYKNIPFDNYFRLSYPKNWIRQKLNLKIPKKNTMYCSEFIELFLKDLNILPKNHDTSISTPSTLNNTYFNGVKLYNKLYRII